MKPTINGVGKICFLGHEFSEGSLERAGYNVSGVLEIEDEDAQREIAERVEESRTRIAAGVPNGHSGGVNIISQGGTLNFYKDVSGRDTIRR